MFHLILVFDYSWMSLTGLFPQKVGVATVMTYVAVEHIVGHERKTGSVKPRAKQKGDSFKHVFIDNGLPVTGLK